MVQAEVYEGICEFFFIQQIGILCESRGTVIIVLRNGSGFSLVDGDVQLTGSVIAIENSNLLSSRLSCRHSRLLRFTQFTVLILILYD